MSSSNTSRELVVAVPAHGDTTAIAYRNEASSPRATLVLAHGAGAGQQSPFMVAFGRALAERGLDVYTFNFLYTERGKRLPDRATVLEACYRAVIEAVGRDARTSVDRLFIGGKSMGGRIATHLAAADDGRRVAGVVALGYPLHPPGRPEQRRDRHLPSIRVPMLIVQGSKDTFGTPDELRPVMATIPGQTTLHEVAGGDHSFKVTRQPRGAQQTVYEGIQQAIVDWTDGVTGTSAP